MNRFSLFAAAMAACVSAIALLPSQAIADVKLLSCASTPDGQETWRFKIDYDRSVVIAHQLGSPDEAPAQISGQTIIWERPRYEPGNGTVIYGARYVLDRYNGQLRIENYCTDRDYETCMPVVTSYCKAIEDRPQF